MVGTNSFTPLRGTLSEAANANAQKRPWSEITVRLVRFKGKSLRLHLMHPLNTAHLRDACYRRSHVL